MSISQQHNLSLCNDRRLDLFAGRVTEIEDCRIETHSGKERSQQDRAEKKRTNFQDNVHVQ